MKDLRADLQHRRRHHLYRQRRILGGAQQSGAIIDNRPVINFCSNDYLGLANHPAIRQAARDAIDRYGVGSGSAHLVCGHSEAHHRLEEELAEFCGYPRCLLFSTGYMANLAIVQSLLGRKDTVLEDRLNHASLLDAGRISDAVLKRYRHHSPADLQTRLQALEPGHETLIMTDGVFSMDGNIARLPELVRLAHRYRAWLMVDDAHGFGTLGADGRGSLQHHSLEAQAVPVYMATLGKALGTAGAFIAGSEDLIETLIQKARTYIYTTATPPAIAEASRCSLKLIQEEPQHRQRLQRNIDYFRTACRQLDLPLTESPTAIQPLIIGDDATALAVSESLFAAGLLVTAIRPPTVPDGTARLRITLSAGHTRRHIDQLVEALATVLAHADASA